MATGAIRVQVFSGENSYIPVGRCKVTITPTEEDGIANGKSKVVYTNQEGLTEEIEMDTPSLENSQTPGKIPYSFADVLIEKDTYLPLLIKGVQVYPLRIALQRSNLLVTDQRTSRAEMIIDVKANTLVGDFPPKIPEEEEKPLPKPQGTVVLPEPVVPEFIIVHAGVPSDNSATNYKVDYKAYIKNVASCEIFSTWPETTIRANVYAIISFTLNRIYTEWYRAKGKNFDITNSTAYDHAFNFGRNIYDNINRIVDDIFSTYIKRVNAKQPLLAQYCDGVRVKCPGWMTQWGSKYLGDEGKVPYDILTNFYGDNIELKRATKVKGSPQSYPGYTLVQGSSGFPVRTIQEQLNRIAQAYPLLPKQAVDGIYGEKTKEAVKLFQQIFGLPQTGEVDFSTWYRISDIYTGVTRIAELRGSVEEEKKIFYPPIIKDSKANIPHVPYYL